MKAIIEGKRFDTETAVEIGNHENGMRSDFSWWDATLYRTPRAGRYFLAGEGGPMTQFGRNTEDGMRGYGERIIPMEKSEALEWAEQHLDAEIIEEEFADMIEEA